MAAALQFGINRLEELGYLPDVCLILHKNYPFRPVGFIDDLIERFVREGADSMIPMQEEGRAIWKLSDGEVRNISPFMPRHLKRDQFFISHFGLGFVTYPKFLRDGTLGLDNVCMYPVSDFMTTLEVRGDESIAAVAPVLEQYWRRDS